MGKKSLCRKIFNTLMSFYGNRTPIEKFAKISQYYREYSIYDTIAKFRDNFAKFSL
jgi:hypothetical protein